MKYIMFVFFVVASGGCFATDYEVDVCKLQSHSDRDIAYMQPCGEDRVSNNACSSGGWVSWEISSFQGQLMYSTALTALMAEKQ